MEGSERRGQVSSALPRSLWETLSGSDLPRVPQRQCLRVRRPIMEKITAPICQGHD